MVVEQKDEKERDRQRTIFLTGKSYFPFVSLSILILADVFFFLLIWIWEKLLFSTSMHDNEIQKENQYCRGKAKKRTEFTWKLIISGQTMTPSGCIGNLICMILHMHK